MIEGSYVVIKFIADTARNEPVNVGVLAWQGRRHALAMDPDAIAKVVRENPRLHPDSLLGLEEVVRERLGLFEDPPDNEIRERLRTSPIHPLQWTEPRLTSLSSANESELQSTVERLVERIVRPRHRTARGSEDMLGQLVRVLQPLIQHGSVHQHHLFRATRTGVERHVDLFANSNTNLALDHIRLDYKKVRDIRLHADAEANKAADILARNNVRLLVLTSFSDDEEYQPANDEARVILESADISIIDSVEGAARSLGLSGR